LPTVDHYEYLRRLRVPEGIFLPGKASTRKLDQPSTPSAEGSSHPMSPTKNNASEPYSHDRDQFSWSPRSSTSSPSLPPRTASTDNERLHALPPLSHLTPSTSPTTSAPWSTRASTSKTHGDYLPRSSEDRKAIESFRLAL
jgi:Gti1/Pac2 family transcription factor